jgi:hypothetical protein
MVTESNILNLITVSVGIDAEVRCFAEDYSAAWNIST